MLRLICLMKNNKDTVGVRLLDEITGEVRETALNKAIKCLNKTNCSNADIVDGKIICTDGSINSLPEQNVSTGSIKNNCAAIIGTIQDDYIMTNALGVRTTLKNKEAINTILNNGCYNGKVVNKNGLQYISAIKGSFKNYYMDKSLLKEDIANQFNHANKEGLLDKFKKQKYKLLGAVTFDREAVLNIPGIMIGNFTRLTIPKGYRASVFQDIKNVCKIIRIAEDDNLDVTLRDVREYVSKFEIDITDGDAVGLLDLENTFNALKSKIETI